MERTNEELEKLLVHRKVLYTRKGEGYPDGDSVEFTIADIKVYDHVVALLGSERDAAYITEENLDEFLAGKKIRYFCLMYDTWVQLLPMEVEERIEEEHVEEEPEPEPAVPEPEPARPKLTGKWERRWWQVFFHYYTHEEGLEDAACQADCAVETAMKHLEDK